MTFIERVKQIKKQKKITTEEISFKTGIPVGTLGKLFSGITGEPKLSTVISIADALGCSVETLLGLESKNKLSENESILLSKYRTLDSYGKEIADYIIGKEYDRITFGVTGGTSFTDRAGGGVTPGTSFTDRAGVGVTPGTSFTDRAGGGVTPDATADAASVIGYASGVADGVSSPSGYKEQQRAVAANDYGRQIKPAAATLFTDKEQVNKGATSLFSGNFEKASRSEHGATILTTPKVITESKIRKLKLFDLPVSAGTGTFLDSDTYEELKIRADGRAKDADFALRISGCSMEPEFHDGDVLLIHEQESVNVGQLGIFIADGEGFFKKFGGNRLISFNPEYDDIPLSNFSSITCRGLVLGRLKPKTKNPDA